MNSLRKHFSVLLTSGATLYASPLLAAEAGEAKTGLPQLDVSLFPTQLFWLAVSFLVLYVLMSKIALPNVKHTQDNRKNIIASELAAAAAANESAKATLVTVEKAMAEARASARATMNTITVQAAREAAERHNAQNHELSRRQNAAESQIATDLEMALKDVKNVASSLAQEVVERVSGAKIQVKA